MYGWKKEYLFEEMTWGQIVMYYKYGVELKYGKQGDKKPRDAKDMTYEELKAEKERLKKQYGDI